MPPLPKDPSTRARRNKAAGARTLHAVASPELPPLPEFEDHEWHALTLQWWRDIWASPMAPEWDPSDIHGLFILARLVDDFWWEPTQALAAEIRLQRQCFGTTPIDRRRLQWEIERGEQAEKTTSERRKSAAPKPRPVGARLKGDPRNALGG